MTSIRLAPSYIPDRALGDPERWQVDDFHRDGLRFMRRLRRDLAEAGLQCLGLRLIRSGWPWFGEVRACFAIDSERCLEVELRMTMPVVETDDGRTRSDGLAILVRFSQSRDLGRKVRLTCLGANRWLAGDLTSGELASRLLAMADRPPDSSRMP